MSAELGAILVKAGKITQEQLDQALTIVQGQKGEIRAGSGVHRSGCHEEEITTFVGKQLNMGTLRLSTLNSIPK